MSWVTGSPSTRSTVSRPRSAASAELNTVTLPVRPSSPAAGTPGQNHELVSPPGSGAAGIHGALTVENTALVGTTAVPAPSTTATSAAIVTTSIGSARHGRLTRTASSSSANISSTHAARSAVVVGAEQRPRARAGCRPAALATPAPTGSSGTITGTSPASVGSSTSSARSMTARRSPRPRPARRSTPASAAGSPRRGRRPTAAPGRTGQRAATTGSRSRSSAAPPSAHVEGGQRAEPDARRGRPRPRRPSSTARRTGRRARRHPPGPRRTPSRSPALPLSTAGAPLRSRRTSSADPAAAVASANDPVNAAVPGNAAVFSKTSKFGDVNRWRRSSWAPKASLSPIGGSIGSLAVDCPPSMRGTTM